MPGKPRLEWDELRASTSLRELFRYKKDGRTRVYNLRVIDDQKAEVWVVSTGGGKESKSRKLVTLENVDDAPAFLQDIERELRDSGWT